MPEPLIAPSHEIDDAVRVRVLEKLDDIERSRDVRILLAVESGSRAWGFPSPDSDYDARFIYVHRPEWYLSLQPGRDVIELPIEEDLDITGWDLRKALNLLLKPNPVMLEWLSSPIRYTFDAAWCDAVKTIAGRTVHGTACIHHYLHLGEGQWNQHVADRVAVNYKKYFYVLRPALAIRWVRLGLDGPPPMNLQALLAGLDLDAGLVAQIGALLDLKRSSREMGTGPRNPSLDHLIEGEFAAARTYQPSGARHDLYEDANRLFQDTVMCRAAR